MIDLPVTYLVLLAIALVFLLELYIRIEGTQYDERAKAIQQFIIAVLSLVRGDKSPDELESLADDEDKSDAE